MANLNLNKVQKGSTHSAQGKGTWRRPTAVTADVLARNWARTFGKKQKRRT